MTEDLTDLQRWIGAEDAAQEILTQTLVDRFRATLGLPDAPSDIAPRLIHFCLCQPTVLTSGLGEDGHPARGGFLPPVPLPRRMWAGSAIKFHRDLRVGDLVRRHSRIADLTIKEGRSGTLCFVTVAHSIAVGDNVLIEERQTIVYRAPDRAPPPVAATAVAQGASVERVDVRTPMLFRYSALTFNSHRIHYDLPYATGVEGYPGLVVHGPLQATLLLHLASRCHDGRPPDTFEFRSAAPLFSENPMLLHADAASDAGLKLWTTAPGGPVATQAKAGWR